MPEVLVERRGAVALLMLNRPDVLNALSVSMAEALAETIEAQSRTADVRVIVITGEGRAFSSGGDIAFMKNVVDRGGRFEDFQPLVGGGPAVVRAILHSDRPVLAAVNGVAAGGGMSLALACDVRWAAEGARFGQSFVKIGLHPDWGAVYTLPRIAGVSRALELMWTGELIDAAEAQRIGIVSRVLPAERLLPELLEFAARLARGPAVALAEIKHSVRESLGYSLEEALARELSAQERCWGTTDAKEGFRAFLEKREAKFQGR
ncbi:MAG TPA: enoyl-CoA hydratase-related protein [Candidatus Omnitrophota bacterium]|nr:enoyl-CoA hydratase-related protein [Candidatus Omnitrophota bacterium]